MYSDEFNDFISDKFGIDADDVSMDLSILSEMEIVNGELVQRQDAETQTDDASNLVTNLFNDLFKDSDVIKSLDKNGDDILNTEEATDFLNLISTNDNNSNSLSLKDIFMGVEQLKKGEYDVQKIEITDDNSVDVQNTEDSHGSSNFGGSSGGG